MAGCDIGSRLLQAQSYAIDTGQDFKEAHHRKFVHREKTRKSEMLHPLATNAGEIDVGPLLAQCHHKACAKDIATRFTGDKIYKRHEWFQSET